MKSLAKVYAHLSCCDLPSSLPWFESLWDRAPDARPMAGLAEWHHGAEAGFQLFENPDDAGHAAITLFVGDLEAEHQRLRAAGLEPGDVEPGGPSRLFQLRDPDGNLVVLVQIPDEEEQAPGGQRRIRR